MVQLLRGIDMLSKDLELEVQEYEFQSFSDKFDDGEVKSFNFKSFT